MRRLGIGWLVAAMMVIALWNGSACWVRADVVYSTLGDGDSWDQDNCYVVLGPDAVGGPRPFAPAMPFTPDFTVTFTSIELPLGMGLIHGTNGLIVALCDDSDGVPGDIIEAFEFDDLPYVFADDLPLSVAFSQLQPTLEEGTTYWVAVFPLADDTAGGWNLSSPLQMGVWAASQDGGGSWTLNPYGGTGIAAFRVNGDPQ